jgi:hypothetical protein
MQATFYAIVDRRGLRRTVKTGPPQTKAGEKFVKILLEVPDSLWAPPKVETVVVKATEGNAASVPAKAEVAKLPGVCQGTLLMKQRPSPGPYRDYFFQCTHCDLTSTWNNEAPHWIFTKKAVA